MLFLLKKERKTLADSEKVTNFAPVKTKGHGSVAQLNRASDYGSEGYRFESCRSHKKEFISNDELFFLYGYERKIDSPAKFLPPNQHSHPFNTSY